jgi:hypothetical protein
MPDFNTGNVLLEHQTPISGDTNPYDIHQILVKIQNIDPGYNFAGG